MEHRRIATATTAALAGFAIFAPAVVLAADDDAAALRERVGELESKLSAMSTRLEAYETQSRADAWAVQQREAETRAMIADVLSDAESRTSLQGAGGGAMYDNGFVIRSADGNFSLKLNGLSQVRYVFNNREQGNGDTSTGGFELPHTELMFSGNVVDPTWVYMISGDFGTDGGFTMLDTYIGKVLGDGWTFVAGRVKVPLSREWLVGDGQQLAVDRSLVDQEFGPSRTEGVAIDYRSDQLHWVFAFTDGHPASGGDLAPSLTRDTEWSYTSRLEYLAMGAWSQFDDFTSAPGSENGLMIGAGVHWQDGEYGTADDELEVLAYTVDVSWESDGWGMYGAFHGRSIESGDDTTDLDQYGFLVQGSYYFTAEWEAFARYEYGDDDGDTDELSIATVGVNRYFAGQKLKWTTDFGWGINGVNSTFADGFLGRGGEAVGWREDATDEDGQFVLRSQLQLAF